MSTYARELLRQRRILDKDLASWLQINTARISLILSGKDKEPSASETVKLESFFELPLATLLSPSPFEKETINDKN